jgi:hypothetical protein
VSRSDVASFFVAELVELRHILQTVTISG